jgi:hypothetical protein
MKKMIFGLAIAATILAACNNNRNKAIENQNVSKNAQIKSQSDSSTLKTSLVTEAKNTISIKEIVSSYLVMKNSLTEDNSTEAAKSGEALMNSFKNFDKATITDVQRKTFVDVEADAMENAEHIAENRGNIVHQREHFEILSKDIYDLVKTFGAGRVLYKDFDPMVNNGKGAFWLSETKEIKNPYMGKAMLSSGSIKEEIK